MIALPHDTSDLLLAPMLLELDANIERLARLPLPELVIEIALVSNIPDWSRADREAGLVRTVCAGVDCRGWECSCIPRGLSISRHGRRVVLGVPPQFVSYLDGAHRATHAG
jgi:hypothetical protein